jgi:hypothetical protein
MSQHEPRTRAQVTGCVAVGVLYVVVMLAAFVGLVAWLRTLFA